jgi:hypothetical protein
MGEGGRDFNPREWEGGDEWWVVASYTLGVAGALCLLVNEGRAG